MPRAGFASLIGRPNAGKSTLLNRMVGAKVAIVSDKPQTTRNRIVAVKNLPGGQIVFVDTPGIHRPLHRMNVRMVDAAVETLREVDVVALIFDASTRPGQGDEYVSNLLTNIKVPVVLVLNKVDVVAKANLLPLIDKTQNWHDFAAIVPVSAMTGDGVDHLEQVLLGQLPEADAIYPEDFLTDQAERTLVAEIVREKVLHHTRNELPFSTAVVVDQFDESERATGETPATGDTQKKHSGDTPATGDTQKKHSGDTPATGDTQKKHSGDTPATGDTQKKHSGETPATGDTQKRHSGETPATGDTQKRHSGETQATGDTQKKHSSRYQGGSLLRLYCTIYVETESQKPIIIGRGGSMIKKIGTEARVEMEAFFDTRVYLDLRVKVDPDWRNNDRTLDEIGVPRTVRKPAKLGKPGRPGKRHTPHRA